LIHDFSAIVGLSVDGALAETGNRLKTTIKLAVGAETITLNRMNPTIDFSSKGSLEYSKKTASTACQTRQEVIQRCSKRGARTGSGEVSDSGLSI
jgi:hypothetical protein